MTKSSSNNVESSSQQTSEEEPNLQGDWSNIFILTLLYTMQGICYGFCHVLPVIMQSKNSVTYNDQAWFSVILWPYTIKILWAPLVDALYVKYLGRRKSWLIPVQYTMGILLIYIAYNVDDWLPESGKPNITMMVYVLFSITFLNATLDIIVDGWSLTMLKKKNVSYSCTCNTTGLCIGIFTASVFTNFLTSEDFCNKYIRFTPGTGGILSIGNFTYACGVLFLLITTLVGIFKKEKDVILEENCKKLSVFQSYKLILDIMKIPGIKTLAIASMTMAIGVECIDVVVPLKIIDAGVTKDDLVMITTTMVVLKFVLPILVSKYTMGLKPISLCLTLMPIKILWGLTFAVLIYYTPVLMKHDGIMNVPKYYYIILVFLFAINEMLFCTMLLTMLGFYSRISDPRFGGTYVTLLNTMRNIGWVLPGTVILKMVDMFTFKECSSTLNECSDDHSNGCSMSEINKIPLTNITNCPIFVDGYYVVLILCVIFGFVWYGIFRVPLKRLESKNNSQWMVNYEQPIGLLEL